MRVGLILLFGLVASIAFFLVMHLRSAARERRIEHVVREVHAMCLIVAETWPDVGIRARLKAALSLAATPPRFWWTRKRPPMEGQH
jgi:hypothetical protein